MKRACNRLMQERTHSDDTETSHGCYPSPSMTEETLQGFKYFRVLAPLLAHLRPIGTERDRAGNRQLFYHQYASLLLLSFNRVTSLRGLQQTTTLAKVQERPGPPDLLEYPQ